MLLGLNMFVVSVSLLELWVAGAQARQMNLERRTGSVKLQIKSRSRTERSSIRLDLTVAM